MLFRPPLKLGLRVAIGLVACTGVASAYPLNPWGVVTPADTFVLNPYLYVYGGPSFNPYLYGSYGFNDSVDVIVGASASLGGGANSFDGVSVMPRYFFAENMGVALYAGYGGGELGIGPEFHGVFGGDSSFQFTFNAAAHFSLGDGYNYSEIIVLAAPEYYFSDQFSVFLEVDPYYVTGGGPSAFAVTLVPGVGFALDPEQAHSFAVGFQVPLQDEALAASSIGIWYATSFGGE